MAFIAVLTLPLAIKKLVETAALFHTDRQEGWADVAPANPVRSERKQPQQDVYGSSSLPLTFGVLAHLAWRGRNGLFRYGDSAWLKMAPA